ncbi:D-alanine--D-alanine ligase [Raineyella antarctica]|uniref:D-alanine--D-alanine ligase n=1 Tax=Raineyella antarctica TaxID=1577474 RepID=A0A1G6HU25_9ACTN|nr:D-alanine--D-alanine ligase [Raineyella antarctica]SDB97704.1 D-alanine--D-alanine ligase [Raineyella antarctica]
MTATDSLPTTPAGSDLGTIVVLAGGLSHERDVSLRSGRRVSQALRDRGCTVVESDVNSDLVALLRQLDDPIVFPLVHGATGEDGSLREVLGLLGVPYVGSTASASRIAFDKSIATPVIAGLGLATPIQMALPDEVFRELGARTLMDAMGESIGFPMMVKPSRSGSALGCTRVDDAEQLPSAMVGAYAYGDVAVVESFIIGTEVAVTVVDRGNGPIALPAVEIRPDSGDYDYSSRYSAGTTRFLTPAEVPDEVAAACADMALRVHDRLGLRDISRTDIIIRDGVPVFLETNVAPGMTETSLVPLALEAAGLELGEVCEDLVRQAYLR